MIDPSVLYRQLERATFSQREQIADEVVRTTPRDELAPLVRGLDHPFQGIRLGVIEILARAGYRESMRKLVQLARERDGDDRVFAIRALAGLAEAGDDFLAEPVQRWLTSGDPFIAPHAQRLASILRVPAGRASATGQPRSSAEPAQAGPAASGEPLDKLVVQLFAATTGSERIALVTAIEQRGARPLAAAAKLTLHKGSADLVALVCRAVIRNARDLPAPDSLLPALEAARRRLGDAPIAQAAIDDAQLALGGTVLSPALLARLGQLDRPQLDAVVRQLCEHPPAEIALHVPAILDALARQPVLWSSLGPALAHAAAEVRDSARPELRAQAERVIDELRAGKPQPPVTVTSVAWVMARTAARGEPLPQHLRIALDRIAAAEAARALAALCTRLATEQAAAVVIAMLRDPSPDARAAARDALAAWQSPWVRIDSSDPPTIIHGYQDEAGQPLVRRGDRLVAAASGDDYVLDLRGRPVPSAQTDAGGCLCCAPPHALVRRRGEGLRCPSTWLSHLRDGGQTLLERDHALGRCKRCDSVRPRVRDGNRAICLDCRAGVPGDEIAVGPPVMDPVIPSEHGRGADPDALPRPPTPAELAQVAPHIRAAMAGNVFLHARDGFRTWQGSGVIIARDGHHIAILTNRHIVESEDSHRLCALKTLVVSGEAAAGTTLWRARRGVDLALVEARVADPDRLGVMALGSGVVQVGEEIFAIGNPLGLAWSYSAGTLSASRQWTTQEGESVRILQTDASLAPGSSGGGLFHRSGHLIGINSFIRQAEAGASAHFALAIDAIRQALSRESVRWRGQLLSELPR